MKRDEKTAQGAGGGRSPLGGLDLLLAAFAARGHVAKAWEELLAAADAFLAALEPVLERGNESAPARSTLGVVKRLRGQIERMKGVSLFAAADLVLSLARSIAGVWKGTEGEEAANGNNGKPAGVKTSARRGHAKRIKIAGDE